MPIGLNISQVGWPDGVSLEPIEGAIYMERRGGRWGLRYTDAHGRDTYHVARPGQGIVSAAEDLVQKITANIGTLPELVAVGGAR